jgi:hypothetical protein
MRHRDTQIPVVLLTAANAEPLSLEALRRLAPTARQIIAENSQHWIHLDEPDIVLNAIRIMFEQIQAATPEAPTSKQEAALPYEASPTHRAPS